MEILIKFFKIFFDKQWILSLFSLLLAAIITIFLPEKIWNAIALKTEILVVLFMIIFTVFIFLILYLILFIIKKFYIQPKNKKINDEQYGKEIINKFNIFFDGLCESEKLIINKIIDSENKKYVLLPEGSYFLDGLFSESIREKFFFRTKKSITIEDKDEYLTDFSIYVGQTFYKAELLLMKEEYYKIFKYIRDKKGKIGHF